MRKKRREGLRWRRGGTRERREPWGGLRRSGRLGTGRAGRPGRVLGSRRAGAAWRDSTKVGGRREGALGLDVRRPKVIPTLRDGSARVSLAASGGLGLAERVEPGSRGRGGLGRRGRPGGRGRAGRPRLAAAAGASGRD